MKKSITLGLVIGVVLWGCKKENTTGVGSSSLELVFEDTTYQITGIAKRSNDSLIVNYPRWSTTYQYAVVQAQGVTGKVAYPTAAMNAWVPGQPGQDKWVCVQSTYFDDAGTLW